MASTQSLRLWASFSLLRPLPMSHGDPCHPSHADAALCLLRQHHRTSPDGGHDNKPWLPSHGSGGWKSDNGARSVSDETTLSGLQTVTLLCPHMARGEIPSPMRAPVPFAKAPPSYPPKGTTSKEFRLRGIRASPCEWEVDLSTESTGLVIIHFALSHLPSNKPTHL